MKPNQLPRGRRQQWRTAMSPICPRIMLQGPDLRIVMQILAFGVSPKLTFANVQHVEIRPDPWLWSFQVFAPWMAHAHKRRLGGRRSCGRHDKGKAGGGCVSATWWGLSRHDLEQGQVAARVPSGAHSPGGSARGKNKPVFLGRVELLTCSHC